MRHKFRDKLSRSDMALINRFRLNPPQSIRKFAEKLGIGVVEIPMGMEHYGFLDHRPELGYESEYVIFVNSHLGNDEKRWTVAHELGHFFLHRDKREGLFDTEIHLTKDRTSYWLLENEESEADNFAEDLFFGGGALEAFVSLHGCDATNLAKKIFGLPVAKVSRAISFYKKYRGLK